jgi:transcription elongation factor GreA
MSETAYITKQRLLELEEEYKYLTTVGRQDIAKKIADARSHGDLSENADYDAAKDEQGLLELKINNIATTLARCQVVSPSDFPNDKVYILSIVSLKNHNNGEVVKYQLVSPVESDFDKGRISVSSPIGRLMLGKKIGDVFDLVVPDGTTKYEIIEIEKAK